jgi:type III pantothenate kinase
MSLNLLAISVGNTRTRIGIFFDGRLDEDSALDNAKYTLLTEKIREAYEKVVGLDDPTVMLASVNPPLAERIESFITAELSPNRFLRTERDIDIPIGRQLDPEAMVGEDRLLNAAGAFEVLQQACVVVDAGTAITVSYIDGAGTFHGGAIAPGASMMLKALHEHTAQLPETTPAKPIEPVGHNTIEAMRSGMYYGLRGMVKELVEQYAEAAGVYPMVVATGGDAEMLFAGDPLIDRIAPQLTLFGMIVTLKKANEE